MRQVKRRANKLDSLPTAKEPFQTNDMKNPMPVTQDSRLPTMKKSDLQWTVITYHWALPLHLLQSKKERKKKPG